MKFQLVCAALTISGAAVANPFGAAAVSDAELSGMRGAIELPGGITARIGVAIETRVDGTLALRTQVSTEAPGVQVFAGGPPTVGAATTVGMGAGRPDIRIERNNLGTTVTVIPATAPTVVTLGSAGDMTPAGQPLPLVLNGPGVATALGTVRLTAVPGGVATELSGPDIAVQQIIGQATGTIVANSADMRVIDTVTTVNVELQGTVLPGNSGGALLGLFGGIR